MPKIDKEKFIKDIKKDLGYDKKYYTEDKSNSSCEKKDFKDFEDFGELFSEFFKASDEERRASLSNPNNIYVNCKLNKLEAQKGCYKTVKFKRNSESGKKENIKYDVKIPADIKDGQKILIHNEGNHNEKDIGNLVVEIKVKK